jgi:hypothetical protein
MAIAMTGLLATAALAGCAATQSTTDAPAVPSGTSAVAAHQTDAAAGPGAECGTVTTAAGLPATARIVRGTLACATVTRVFTDYYTALARGQAPGNGGGGPVPVDGWTCQSAPAQAAPVSTCDNNGSEITARVLVN